MLPTSLPTISIESINKTLRVAINILRKWNATPKQISTILCISSASMTRALNKIDITLNNEQIDRVSYILNIHQALRIVFDNPANIYGFVHMPNNNPYFNGETPFNMMLTGSLENLHATFKRIDALRGTGW